MALMKAKTRCGTVVGVRGNNPSFTVFKGIPYAAPPVGELRFCPPAAHEPWSDEMLCNGFGPTPIEDLSEHIGDYGKEFYSVQMPISEDCLRLHIWTPAAASGENLPVMVWYHGGGYSRGYAYEMEFDGEAICKRGCILVSVGYRLGALGFLAHPFLSKRSGNGRSGNYGSLDQIFALQWVRDNIREFGGNPDNVTIFGQSAGGGAMRTMLASPLARGLFHRTIVQSAGGIGPGLPEGFLAGDEACGSKLVASLGWKPEELITRPAQDIYFKLLDAAYEAGMPMVFRPTIDNYLLTRSANESINYGDVADVPIMCGAVAGDGGRRNLEKYKENPEFEEIRRMAPAVDTMTWGYVYDHLKKKTVYSYYFDRQLPGDDWGKTSFHSCELWYTFGTLYRSWRPFTGYDYELSSMMTDYWTNFAKNGNPNGVGLPQWNAFSSETPETMNFGNEKVEAHNYFINSAIRELIEENTRAAGIII